MNLITKLDFKLKNESKLQTGLRSCIKEGFELGEINYIFCDDDYLHKLNVEFLNHDTLTDIISFDNTLGKLISGDIFISIERVKENAMILMFLLKKNYNELLFMVFYIIWV